MPWKLLLLADPAEELVHSYIQESQVYLAESGNTVVGICVVQPQTHVRAEIRNLAVAPNCQGRGVGKALLKYAEEQAQQQGICTLRVCTGNSSLGPLALYQKSGFAMVDLQLHFFTQQYPEPIWEDGILCQHLLVLEKDLSA
ncbi:GNAT family N-acetyltransferase [Hymenobacter lutimineralis]|uniref:GNAT family N-acetyltransferase n=1 Tax=Hymenobacter lutimineralis TaxID=2606448 RepID=UPI00165630AB|nr:GNAT family N-acetyltransferase [Hymenobacter lutimineralis]